MEVGEALSCLVREKAEAFFLWVILFVIFIFFLRTLVVAVKNYLFEA